jgi:hypothetical protein
MSQLACLHHTEKLTSKLPAPVVPLRIAKGESVKQHGKDSKEKAPKELPLFYNRPIFRAKKHDPL